MLELKKTCPYCGEEISTVEYCIREREILDEHDTISLPYTMHVERYFYYHVACCESCYSKLKSINSISSNLSMVFWFIAVIGFILIFILPEPDSIVVIMIIGGTAVSCLSMVLHRWLKKKYHVSYKEAKKNNVLLEETLVDAFDLEIFRND